MNMTDRINEFLKGSVGLIDDVDIAREMNATQVKYGKKLFNTDLEINAIECQINKFNTKTSEINHSIDDKKAEFSKLQKSLAKFN